MFSLNRWSRLDAKSRGLTAIFKIGAECQNRTDLISLEGWVLTLSNPANLEYLVGIEPT